MEDQHKIMIEKMTDKKTRWRCPHTFMVPVALSTFNFVYSSNCSHNAATCCSLNTLCNHCMNKTNQLKRRIAYWNQNFQYSHNNAICNYTTTTGPTPKDTRKCQFLSFRRNVTNNGAARVCNLQMHHTTKTAQLKKKK